MRRESAVFLLTRPNARLLTCRSARRPLRFASFSICFLCRGRRTGSTAISPRATCSSAPGKKSKSATLAMRCRRTTATRPSKSRSSCLCGGRHPNFTARANAAPSPMSGASGYVYLRDCTLALAALFLLYRFIALSLRRLNTLSLQLYRFIASRFLTFSFLISRFISSYLSFPLSLSLRLFLFLSFFSFSLFFFLPFSLSLFLSFCLSPFLTFTPSRLTNAPSSRIR